MSEPTLLPTKMAEEIIIESDQEEGNGHGDGSGKELKNEMQMPRFLTQHFHNVASHSLNFRSVKYELVKRSMNILKCKREESRTKILRGVGGDIAGGQLVAIMGASGSGKTSLVTNYNYLFFFSFTSFSHS
jgi:ABC-type glutathione transport system ATPase component